MLDKSSHLDINNDISLDAIKNSDRPKLKFLRIDWLGQTLASLCWVISVFVYGFASGDGLQMSLADWLQLTAASSWFIANIATLIID